jgi:hypothetical protein
VMNDEGIGVGPKSREGHELSTYAEPSEPRFLVSKRKEGEDQEKPR